MLCGRVLADCSPPTKRAGATRRAIRARSTQEEPPPPPASTQLPSTHHARGCVVCGQGAANDLLLKLAAADSRSSVTLTPPSHFAPVPKTHAHAPTLRKKLRADTQEHRRLPKKREECVVCASRLTTLTHRPSVRCRSSFYTLATLSILLVF